MSNLIYKLKTKKYKKEGDITWEYNALRNLKREEEIVDFQIDNSIFKLDLKNPVDIECQPAYDGTVNLIINDDVNPPRIINSRYTRTENNTYKVIDREQINQSNLYREEFLDRETRLFRNTNGVTKILLSDIGYTGKLKAGNYIFYMKYMDDDYNETDIVAQTGAISIFNGTLHQPKTISGGLMEEETDKSIALKFIDLDTSFSYIKLYVYRTSCDSNGIKLDYAYKIDKDYEIINKDQTIYINGFEDSVDISVEELNIQYNVVNSVKSQAQVQNMLFFANVTKDDDIDSDLQLYSLYISANQTQGNSIGYVDPKHYCGRSEDDVHQIEYYSPINLYYNLGYWPDEYYRFGIVYIYNDDHLSPVYNLRGCKFIDDGDSTIGNICTGIKNADGSYRIEPDNYLIGDIDKNPIPVTDEWIVKGWRYLNTKGVFRFKKSSYGDLINTEGCKPIGIEFSFPKQLISLLHKKNVKGFFFVRQPRIPTILCQGYSVGIDKAGYFPMINKDDKYIVESFKDSTQTLTTDYHSRQVTVDSVDYSGLICVDANVNKQVQSFFDTSEFILEKIYNNTIDEWGRHFVAKTSKDNPGVFSQSKTNLLYIPTETPQKVYDKYSFSTKAGMQEDLKYNAFIGIEDKESEDVDLTRGIFTGFIGATSKLDDNHIYNIRIKNYNEAFSVEYFEIRMNDNSPYYTVSDRYCISPKKDSVDYKTFGDFENKDEFVIDSIFRGDCFVNTVTVRMHRNFISSSTPINDTIIDEATWKENFKGLRNTTDWNKINKADVDAVPIGSWLTYKCLSNYNLSLRCNDPFQIEEQAIMGNERSFYPKSGMSIKSSNKIPESTMMNDGYNSLLGVKRHFTFDIVPYTRNIFDTRIMFSNVQVDGEFKNSYKVFQGLSYEDIDRQYGSIVKILSWGVNLFCVFEHGLAIIPVNEKALLQTTEGANIHMYGTGVLQKQVVLISDSVGSTWKDSIIKTPVAIYGVDTETHKIWRYSDDKKLEILSDFSMQRFLHDNIDLKEAEKYTILGFRNVKTHYNAFKKDVMFTYYNNNREWNICYNETLGKWISRYSWTPYMSENIDYAMFSFDLKKTKPYGIYNFNNNASPGSTKIDLVDENDNAISWMNTSDKIKIKLSPPSPYDRMNINSISLIGCKFENNVLIEDELFNQTFDSSTEEHIFTGIISGTIYNVNTEYSDGNEDTKNDTYLSYKNIEDKTNEIYFNESEIELNDRLKYLYYYIKINYLPYLIGEEEVPQTPPSPALYIGSIVFANSPKTLITSIIKSYKYSYSLGEGKDDEKPYYLGKYSDNYNNALVSSIYVHGRSINSDEINYFDSNKNNQCLPTKWYDRQEPFEFEFIVSEPKGTHKIFDNLVIVSNNVEPESLEIEIEGDVYGFDKSSEYKVQSNNKNSRKFVDMPLYKNNEEYKYEKMYSTKVKWNSVDNVYTLVNHQDCANIKNFGRRLGNIYYNEDKWYMTLRPIYYKDFIDGPLKSTRIRDKYARIRVKYSGTKLAIIVALQTLFTTSYV